MMYRSIVNIIQPAYKHYSLHSDMDTQKGTRTIAMSAQNIFKIRGQWFNVQLLSVLNVVII